MALSSSSTLEDALNQFNDNLDWDGDATKARAALAAVRFLIVNRPASNSVGGRSLDWADLADEKRRLETFINGAGASNVCAFTSGRMLSP